MRLVRFSRWLFVPSFLAACACLWACGKPAPAGPATVKLPAGVGPGVLRGDHFYAVAAGGRLIDVDLKQQKVTDLGIVDAKLIPCLDVGGGKACVASDRRVYIVDLAGGEAPRSFECRAPVRGVGFVADDRVFVHHGTSVEIVSLPAGEVLHTIDLAPGEKSRKSFQEFADGLVECRRAGDRLYVTCNTDSGLTVIDLKEGKRLERMATVDWRIGSIHVAGDQLFILGVRYGYGVWTNSLERIDLKTHQHTSFKMPRAPLQPGKLLGGPGGSVFMSTPGGAYEYSAAGELLGKVDLPAGGRLASLYDGRAVVVGADKLQVVPLTRTTVKAN
jgi:hypothetical protein